MSIWLTVKDGKPGMHFHKKPKTLVRFISVKRFSVNGKQKGIFPASISEIAPLNILMNGI